MGSILLFIVVLKNEGEWLVLFRILHKIRCCMVPYIIREALNNN